MKLFLLILTSFFSLVGFAQKEKANKYIQQYKDAAITEMRRGGVPASIILAQGMLESSYGESELCKKSNNHFGIKCKNDWDGETTYHNDDENGECFRVYASAAESYKDHTNFLKSRTWYAFLFKLSPTDYEGWAKGLKKAGYATEKEYANRLIKVIVDNDLQQYTLAGLADETTTTDTSVDKETTIQQDTTKVNNTDEEDEVENTTEENHTYNTTIPQKDTLITTQSDTTNNTKPLYTPDSIFIINHAKVIYVLAGTSFLSIANNYKISLSTLFIYNDMQPIDIVDTNRLIFIERKLKKGAVELYTSQGNETLYQISQSQGVQLESLLSFNKNLKKETVLAKGDKVYLRSASKK